MTINKIKELKEQVKASKGALTVQLVRLESFEEDLSVVKFTDLKLHKIASFSMNDLTCFDDFCQEQYEIFEEFMQEEAPKVYRKYLGSTSSFYFTTKCFESLGITIVRRHYGFLMESIIEESSDRFAPDELIDDKAFLDIYTQEYGKPSSIDDMIDLLATQVELLEELSDNIEYFIDSLKEDFEQVKKAYDYLNNFKENQLEIYDDYFDAY